MSHCGSNAGMEMTAPLINAITHSHGSARVL